MKFLFYKHSPVVLLVMLISGCAKQNRDLRMTNEEFLYPAVQLLKYQHELDLELLKLRDTQGLTIYINGRNTGTELYTEGLRALYTLPQAVISSSAKSDLERLRNSSGEGHRKLLLSLVVIADQELIGLHVKASGPTGLIDPNLYQWTDQKIPMLTARLNESQILWRKL